MAARVDALFNRVKRDSLKRTASHVSVVSSSNVSFGGKINVPSREEGFRSQFGDNSQFGYSVKLS